jgi:hypothetical protein
VSTWRIVIEYEWPDKLPTTTQREGSELVEVTTRLHVGWTTDPEKAEAARNAGATVTTYTAASGDSGWEVSAREVVDA